MKHIRLSIRQINMLLAAVVAVLLVLCVMSVWSPIRFDRERTAREADVKRRLLLVRAAAERYRHDHGAYTGRLQCLVDSGYLADSLQYIPHSGGRRFALEASVAATRSGRMVPVMECSATYADYLHGLDAGSIAELDQAAAAAGWFPGLKIGDLAAPGDNSGNWE